MQTNKPTSNAFSSKKRKEKPAYRLGGYIVLAAVFLALHFLLELRLFAALAPYLPFLQKLTLSLSIIMLIVLIGKIIEQIIHSRSESEGNRYNLLRITRLLTTVFVLIVIISFLFQNLYAIAVSFGLFSLVLGFALQAPISSFIAWLYIVFRRPYKVGDRIQIEKYRGDVVEVNYLDTAILECSGEYLQNDRRSGRVVYFPNSLILRAEVINYAGPFVPFIWNETALQIAYSSDVQFVEDCLLQAARTDFARHYTGHDPEAAQWQPAVYFRVNTYAWLEAVLSYPVVPMDTTERRNRILKQALPLLNAHPEKVQFPEGTLR